MQQFNILFQILTFFSYIYAALIGVIFAKEREKRGSRLSDKDNRFLE